MAELRQKIQEHINLLTRNGQAGRNTFGPDAIDNARLNHDEAGIVKVTLAIPVPPLLRQMRAPAGSRSRNRDLFQDRDDQMALGAVQDCVDIVSQADHDIQAISRILQDPAANPVHVLTAMVATTSAATRKFAVDGGRMDMNADGRPLCLEAPVAKAAIEYPDLTRLQFRLHQNHRYAAPYTGEILAVGDGPAGVSRPGSRLTLGFLKERLAVRALLELARQLRVDIWVQVRMAVSPATLNALTAEVLAVESIDEIIAAMRVQTPDRQRLGFQ